MRILLRGRPRTQSAFEMAMQSSQNPGSAIQTLQRDRVNVGGC
jgi:hypothetical protein